MTSRACKCERGTRAVQPDVQRQFQQLRHRSEQQHGAGQRADAPRHGLYGVQRRRRTAGQFHAVRGCKIADDRIPGTTAAFAGNTSSRRPTIRIAWSKRVTGSTIWTKSFQIKRHQEQYRNADVPISRQESYLDDLGRTHETRPMAGSPRSRRRARRRAIKSRVVFMARRSKNQQLPGRISRSPRFIRTPTT